MSRNIKRHPVELLIVAFLKKLTGARIRQEKNTIDKLSKIIGAILVDPCCNNTEVSFNTPKETYITVSVVNALNGIDVRKWRESLERAKKLLDDKLDNPCCLNSTFRMTLFGVTATLSVNDSTTNTNIDFTTAPAAAAPVHLPIGHTIEVVQTNNLDGFCLDKLTRIVITVRDKNNNVIDTLTQSSTAGITINKTFVVEDGKTYEIVGTAECHGS